MPQGGPIKMLIVGVEWSVLEEAGSLLERCLLGGALVAFGMYDGGSLPPNVYSFLRKVQIGIVAATHVYRVVPCALDIIHIT